MIANQQSSINESERLFEFGCVDFQDRLAGADQMKTLFPTTVAEDIEAERKDLEEKRFKATGFALYREKIDQMAKVAERFVNNFIER